MTVTDCCGEPPELGTLAQWGDEWMAKCQCGNLSLVHENENEEGE